MQGLVMCTVGCSVVGSCSEFIGVDISTPVKRSNVVQVMILQLYKVKLLSVSP